MNIKVALVPVVLLCLLANVEATLDPMARRLFDWFRNGSDVMNKAKLQNLVGWVYKNGKACSGVELQDYWDGINQQRTFDVDQFVSYLKNNDTELSRRIDSFEWTSDPK